MLSLYALFTSLVVNPKGFIPLMLLWVGLFLRFPFQIAHRVWKWKGFCVLTLFIIYFYKNSCLYIFSKIYDCYDRRVSLIGAILPFGEVGVAYSYFMYLWSAQISGWSPTYVLLSLYFLSYHASRPFPPEIRTPGVKLAGGCWQLVVPAAVAPPWMSAPSRDLGRGFSMSLGSQAGGHSLVSSSRAASLFFSVLCAPWWLVPWKQWIIVYIKISQFWFTVYVSWLGPNF